MWSRKKKPAMERAQHLALKPRRARGVVVERKEDGGAVVKLPIRGTWPFRAPNGATRTFELDEMGLLVWDSCDGKTTLLALIRKFSEHYRLNQREAEVSTLKFLQTLSRKRLIGMMREAD